MDSRFAAASLLLVLLVTSQWPSSSSFGFGAPDSDGICKSLVPGHRNTTARGGPSPFTLALSQGGAAQGEPLNITLTSRHGFHFKGLMVQARAADSLNPIGSFFLHDPDNTKTLTCLGGAENTVTHSNPSEKNSTTFEWVPPADFHGTIVFNATVVQDYSTFWTGVTASALIGDPSLIGSTAGISTTQAPVTTLRTSTTGMPLTARPTSNGAVLPIYDGCGSSKACFGFPENCESNGNCNYMVSVFAKGETKYQFELMTSYSDSKYVAVGLSDDKSMGADLVMECVLKDSGSVEVFQSWNIENGKGNTRLSNNGDVETLSVSNNDNTKYCQFERNAVTTVNDKTYDLVNTKYYLLLATGNSIKGGGDVGVGYHNIPPIASANKEYLSDVNAFKVASKILIRLHGAFMIGAWIGAASIGIVLARYFKQTWTGSQLCGKDQWFAWHRILMILVWSLTIAAFILIFIELKAWSTEDKHAILGVITTALAFFQPIGAIFRPSPDSRRRPIFNWAHWFVGNSAHILGIVSIFLAGQLSKAELPNWWIWIMVGYVAFHVIMHLMLSVAGCISERQNSQRINSFPMKEMSNSRTPLSTERNQEAPHSCFRKFLLAFYIFGILVITIALIVIVVLAPIEKNIEELSKSLSNISNSG